MRRADRWSTSADGSVLILAAVSASFFLGGLAGCLLAGCVDGGGQESLAAYVEGFLRAAQAGEAAPPALAALVWETLRWPLLALLLGFTALGLLALPLLFAVRGFLLAFSIASFVRLFGGTGCLLALLVFGVGGAFSVPALFVLGVQSFMTARTLAGRVRGESKAAPPYGRAYWLRCGGCAAALCVCMLLDGFAVPALVSGLVSSYKPRDNPVGHPVY